MTDEEFFKLPECPLDPTGVVPSRAGLLVEGKDFMAYWDQGGRAWGTHTTLEGSQERFRKPRMDEIRL